MVAPKVARNDEYANGLAAIPRNSVCGALSKSNESRRRDVYFPKCGSV